MIRDLLLRGIKQQELLKVVASNCSLAVLQNLLSLLHCLRNLVLKLQEGSLKHTPVIQSAAVNCNTFFYLTFTVEFKCTKLNG